MRTLLRYLELIFTLLGLVVIAGVTAFITPFDLNPWQVAAITAVVVGVIHGIIFWIVRRRQRNARLRTVDEIQAMLKDVINNQLTVIQGMDFLRTEDPTHTQRATEQITRSVASISDALQHLSEESLQAWRSQYIRHASKNL